MWKKIYPFLIALGIGCVLGGWTVYSIAKAGYSRQLAKLSADIRAGELINISLQSDNRALKSANNDALRTVSELRAQIERDHRQFDAQIGRIKESVSDIGSELTGSASSIQDVVAGLRALRTLIEALP